MAGYAGWKWYRATWSSRVNIPRGSARFIFYEFIFAHERITQAAGRLAMKSRPQEVIEWGRRQRNTPAPVIADVLKFQENWTTWWGGCQPKWRATKSWPFPHGDMEGGDWARLNVTGPHGLFAVVISTSWWATSPGLGPHRAAYDAAIADLHWVIKRLLDYNSRLQGTRPEPAGAAAAHFPGHGERGVGKRKIKPSSKACFSS